MYWALMNNAEVPHEQMFESQIVALVWKISLYFKRSLIFVFTYYHDFFKCDVCSVSEERELQLAFLHICIALASHF